MSGAAKVDNHRKVNKRRRKGKCINSCLKSFVGELGFEPGPLALKISTILIMY